MGTGMRPCMRASICRGILTDRRSGIIEWIVERNCRARGGPRGVGTGQGLPLVRATVERHGGSIHFETMSGEGTTFVLIFPVEGRAIVAA